MRHSTPARVSGRLAAKSAVLHKIILQRPVKRDTPKGYIESNRPIASRRNRVRLRNMSAVPAVAARHGWWDYRVLPRCPQYRTSDEEERCATTFFEMQSAGRAEASSVRIARKRKEFRSVLARSSHQGPTYTLTHASILRVAGRYHLPAKNPTGCIMFGASKVLSPRLVLREACSMSTDTGGDIRFKKCHARQEQSAVCHHLNEVHNASDVLVARFI